MSNFKKLTLKRKSNVKAVIVALAITATVPVSLFAYSSSDVTSVDGEIGNTAEPTDSREVMSNVSEDATESEEGATLENIGDAYQINSIGTQDPLHYSIGSVLNSMGGQIDSVKIAASKAEQDAIHAAELQAEEDKKGTETSGQVYLDGNVVYKPSTHYVHRSECRWADETCYRVTSADSLEVFIRDIESMLTGNKNIDITYQVCTECNPLGSTGSNEEVGHGQVADVNNNGVATRPTEPAYTTVETTVQTPETSTEMATQAPETSNTSQSETSSTSGTTESSSETTTGSILETVSKLDYYTPSVGTVYDGSGLPSASVAYDYQGAASAAGITDYDILLLRRIVSSEYGSNWVPVEEKAKIVAGVMNMMKHPDPWYPDTIEEILAKTCEPWGFNRYKNYYMDDSIIMAVDYYFAYSDTFGTYKSWWGDGRWNHFHNYD